MILPCTAVQLIFQLLDIVKIIKNGGGIFRQTITAHLHQEHVTDDIHHPIILSSPMTVADMAGVSPSIRPFHWP